MPTLAFDNRFVAELPGDPESSNRRRQVLGAAWSPAAPTPVAAPRLLAHAREVAELVAFTEEDVRAPWFAEVFAGNQLLPGMQPYAACYGGHQFGNWAGQLGDGRAITLGEVVNARGERWELQLKGAGPTPYSRTADGRAVLRSSIREFLCSEAMHHLGVPTTRALSVVTTGEAVVRDMFYDGNARPEPGAVVCRVAPSFIRFGNFEIFAARDDVANLERLIDFTIARDYPHLSAESGDAAVRRARWFAEICERTARMVVHWMRVGFVHGVMNTDNMSILGLTIDYGPYGWLDDFDPHWTPNTTDAGGRRYRYAQQPAVAQWNLVRLAEALHLVIGDEEPLQAGLERFHAVYTAEYQAMSAASSGCGRSARPSRRSCARGTVCSTPPRWTTRGSSARWATVGERCPRGRRQVALLDDVFYDAAKAATHQEALDAWLRRWHAHVSADGEPAAARRVRMHAVNPRFVLRNYLAQEAIDQAAEGDPSLVHTLLDVMRRPYDEQPGQERFAARRPEWARHRAGCSMLSCSS
jgi:uncharacterized protein YdiU (UPF0061 family)